MRSGFRVVAASAIIAAAGLMIQADGQVPSQSADIQLRLGRMLFEQGQYPEALDAFRLAVNSEDSATTRQARSGLIQAALRTAEFVLARTEADTLVKMAPRSPEVLALYADSLWAAGLFEQAEEQYRDALSLAPELARGRHGVARSLMARSKLDEAMNEAQAALRLSPRDLEIHHTVGAIYERMHKYEEAAAAYGNYVNLLPNKDKSDKAEWARAQIRFLRSFGQRLPFDMDPGADNEVYTVDFKLEKEKIVVRAKVNGSGAQDFVVDTGAESTVLTRPTAQRLGITPVTYTLSAGVGDVGLRGLQLARIDSLELGTLKVRNIPVPREEPAAARHPDARNGKPVAARARLLDDDRLQDAQADVRQAPAAGAERLRAAAPRLPARHGPRRRHRRPRRELRRRHRRRGDLDQPRDGDGDRQERRAPDSAEGVGHVRVGEGRVPAAGRGPVVRRDSATRTSRSWC